MKKVLKITGVLCLLMAVSAVIFGIFAGKVSNRSFFMGYAIINVVRGGDVMGFIGNIAVIAFTVVCYGMAGFSVLLDKKKNALIWSAITSILAILSLVMAIVNKNLSVTLGDIIVAAIPIVQTYLVIQTAD